MVLSNMLKVMAIGAGTADLIIATFVMTGFGILQIYLGLRKGYEPFLMTPLGVGCIMISMPGTDFMDSDFLYFKYICGF